MAKNSNLIAELGIPSARMTVAEFARHRSVSVGTVGKAVTSGRVEKGPDGKIDVAKADAYWHALTKAGSGRGADEQAGPPELAAARLRRELANADLAELKAGEIRGELVSTAIVQATWHAAARVLRERLLALPAQIAPLLTGNLKDHDIRRILDTAIRQALLDLPEEPPS